MKKIKLALLFLIIPFFTFAQMDCSNFQNRKPEPPYELSSLTRGAVCITGHTYEFVIPLSKGFEYPMKREELTGSVSKTKKSTPPSPGIP